jgi:RNA polymerase sigma-70 factor (ECF subfamily)
MMTGVKSQPMGDSEGSDDVNSALSSTTRMEALLAGQMAARGHFLFRVAYNILRDDSEAEDVCQQAFMKAWEYQDRFRAYEALGSWLTQTVVNESLALHRRKKTESRALEHHSQDHATWDEPAADNQEQREMVLLEVARLAEPVRLIVVLRLLEGMSGNQVAELLECTAVEVSRRLHQGMEILRGKLTQRHANTGDR